MKSRFKHFIALTVLLANGIASFGQQTTETDTIGKTGTEYWWEWLENRMNPDNPDNQGNNGQGGTNNGQGGTSSQGTTSQKPKEIEIDEKNTTTTCEEITIYWKNRPNVEFYGLDFFEDGEHIGHSECEGLHCDYSYYDYNRGYNRGETTMNWHKFKNLKPGKKYQIDIYGYTINGKIIVLEQSLGNYYWTESITISSSTGKDPWGYCGTVKVDAPSDCVVTKWEYDTKVLVPRDGDSFSRKFEVLRYGVSTKVSATIMCPSGNVYTRDITIAIKPLKLYCESNDWKCNSVIKMNLENAPASLKTVKWTSSDNLQICYSGFNNTIKYAYFQIKGTGRAWIKASFTYNGITYTKQFSYNIPGLASPVIYAPPTSSGTYTPGQPYLFSVNKVSGATSYDWQFTHAGICSWPNDEEYGNAANIIINSQPSSQDKICKFEIRVAAKNSCGTGNYATYSGYVPRNYSRMAHNNITDTVAIDNNSLLLSVDELNMESQESSFIVYPNPATTELNITQTVSSNALSLTKDATIKTVDIFDVKGNKCASHVFNDAQTTATIDITDLANGIFVLVINKDSDDAWTGSFVKK